MAMQLAAEVGAADSTFGAPGAKLGQSRPPPGVVLLLNAVFCPIRGVLESPFNISLALLPRSSQSGTQLVGQHDGGLKYY